MELSELFCMLAMGTHLILGGVVLYRSPRSPVNQTFAVLLLLFFWWSLAEVLLLRRGGGFGSAKFLLTPVVLLSFFFARFTALFPRRVENSMILGSLVRTLLFFLPTAFLLGLLWSDRLIANFDIIPGGFLISFGWYEFAVKGIAVAYLLLSLKNLSMARKELSSEFQERRFHYTFAGLVLPVAAGSVFIALGRWYVTGRTIYTFGIFPALGIIMAALIAYAMLRYQLMEIDLLFSIGLIYTLLTIILAGGMELLQNMLQNYFDLTGTWSVIFSTLLIAALFSPLKDLIVRLVDKVFGKKELDTTAVMQRIKACIHGSRSPQSVLEKILEACQEIFELETTALVFRNGPELRKPLIPDATLPPLPETWSKLDDIEALMEAGRESGATTSPFAAWKVAGFRFAFPIRSSNFPPSAPVDTVDGGLFLTPRPGRLPFSRHERTILAGICLEIPTILENVTLISALIEHDRDLRDLEWARRMYQQIQGNPNLKTFQGWNIRLFSSLAKQIKGDLIDLCAKEQSPFIALCDAFHSGIPAVLTLYIVHTALRASPTDDRLATVHRGLAEFSDPPLRSALTLIAFPAPGKVRLINAGNIPPMRLGPDGSCTILTGLGRPLGLEGVLDAATADIDLMAGQMILCTTNGLAKAFGDPDGANLAAFLRLHAPKTSDSCHEAIQTALAALPGRLEFPDDITYILLGG